MNPSCVDLKHSAFLAQLLLEEVDLESTSEPAPHVGKPVLHMQPMHTGEPVARSPDALARPASNNMPLSEHDTQELRRLLYLKAEGIERQGGCNTSVGMQIRSEFNLNSPNSLRIRSQREFAANSASNS